MDKSLSFCVPAAAEERFHPGGLGNLANTLSSFLAAERREGWQYEIVVGVDGRPGEELLGLLDGFGAQCPLRWSFVPRPDETGRSNKNAARILAVGLSRGAYVMCLDQDLYIGPQTPAALAVALEQSGPGDVVFTIDMQLTEPIDAARPPSLRELMRRAEPWHYDQRRARRHLKSRPGLIPLSQTMHEGQPVVSREVYFLAGGMDESFRGWGGNKEDFTRRLSYFGLRHCLAGGALLFHQPHARTERDADDGASGGRELYRRLWTRRLAGGDADLLLRRRLIRRHAGLEVDSGETARTAAAP